VSPCMHWSEPNQDEAIGHVDRSHQPEANALVIRPAAAAVGRRRGRFLVLGRAAAAGGHRRLRASRSAHDDAGGRHEQPHQAHVERPERRFERPERLLDGQSVVLSAPFGVSAAFPHPLPAAAAAAAAAEVGRGKRDDTLEGMQGHRVRRGREQGADRRLPRARLVGEHVLGERMHLWGGEGAVVSTCMRVRRARPWGAHAPPVAGRPNKRAAAASGSLRRAAPRGAAAAASAAASRTVNSHSASAAASRPAARRPRAPC